MMGRLKIFTRAPPVFRESWYKLYVTLGLVTASFCGLGGVYCFPETFSSFNSISGDSGIAVKPSEFLRSKIKTFPASTKLYDLLKKGEAYTSRPKLESQIKRIIETKHANGTYYVLYGAKGVGKSAVVQAAVQGRQGILQISVSSPSDKQSLLNALAQLTGSTHLNPGRDDFESALHKCFLSDGSLPTIIFEAERWGDVYDARVLCEKLARYCNCILILSEETTFKKSNVYESFIFVGELEDEEVKKFVEQNGMMLNDVEIKKIIDNIGANPTMLKHLKVSMLKGLSLDEFIEKVLKSAEQELVSFKHQSILRALKDHPEGVDLCYLLHTKALHLSNDDVVEALKDCNVIIYRKELRMYMVNSKAIEVALRSYDPIPLPFSLKQTIKSLL